MIQPRPPRRTARHAAQACRAYHVVPCVVFVAPSRVVAFAVVAVVAVVVVAAVVVELDVVACSHGVAAASS